MSAIWQDDLLHNLPHRAAISIRLHVAARFSVCLHVLHGSPRGCCRSVGCSVLQTCTSSWRALSVQISAHQKPEHTDRLSCNGSSAQTFTFGFAGTHVSHNGGTVATCCSKKGSFFLLFFSSFPCNYIGFMVLSHCTAYCFISLSGCSVKLREKRWEKKKSKGGKLANQNKCVACCVSHCEAPWGELKW